MPGNEFSTDTARCCIALAIVADAAAACRARGRAILFLGRSPVRPAATSSRSNALSFRSHFGNPCYPPPPVVDCSKPPPPRKIETPPTSTVVVIGDFLADWLAYGLEEALPITPEIGIVRNIRPTSGLIRYDAKNDTLDWSAAVKDILGDRKAERHRRHARPQRPHLAPRQRAAGGKAAEPDKPRPDNAAGRRRQSAAGGAATDTSCREIAAAAPRPGRTLRFHTDKWAELYSKRIDDMIAALKSQGRAGAVGRAAGDPRHQIDRRHELISTSFIASAPRGPASPMSTSGTASSTSSGRYAVQGPDFEGQTRRLRTGDGVHFTKAGAVKLARYVDTSCAA